ncbi:S-methyl-5-thioribose-1-phosphate isomerase [bacterium]|nr:S-methyl-5-thioribose-1-phosphate isomerase [bacterium]MCG2676201.1 S-methyl-5-thioribose-1-phosphate isomerase [bacterium]
MNPALPNKNKLNEIRKSGVKVSPLFWPVSLKSNTILCLDETALPQELIYLKARNLNQAINLIKSMKTRAFGQVLMAYHIFLLLLKKSKELKPERQIKVLKKAALEINRSRPTFPFSFFTEMVLVWAGEAKKKGKDIPAFTENRIKTFLSYLKEKRIAQARALSRLIKDRDSILTHCNVSGSLVLAAQFCRKTKKKIRFFVTETRPYLQGSRLTAWELQRARFKVTIIPDSSVAYVMSKGLVGLVVVGADQKAQNGDIANKIGTYQIALLARYFNLPFYVLSPPPSGAKTGKDIKIEVRAGEELLEFWGKRIAPKGAKGFYPAFDITPHKLISKHITLGL